MECNYICSQCNSLELDNFFFEKGIELSKWAKKGLCYSCFKAQNEGKFLPSVTNKENYNVLVIGEMGKGTSFKVSNPSKEVD
ncbi:hypothetical protein ACMGD3_24285 [Lysinibacillus sphaericus]|uniref:hypothetical protein n=1 Tax=Lysinibacillus sphaericus TaxID=1421 RepID=UPI003F79B4BF